MFEDPDVSYPADLKGKIQDYVFLFTIEFISLPHCFNRGIIEISAMGEQIDLDPRSLNLFLSST